MKDPIELVFAASHEGEPNPAAAGSLAEASRATAVALGFEAQVCDRVVDGRPVPGSYIVKVLPPKPSPEEVQRIHAAEQGYTGMHTIGSGAVAVYLGALQHADENVARMLTWIYLRALIGKLPEST